MCSGIAACSAFAPMDHYDNNRSSSSSSSNSSKNTTTTTTTTTNLNVWCDDGLGDVRC